LDQARTQVLALLDELQAQFQLDSSKIVLGGFSQGAIACLDVALRDSRRLAGLLLMSGTMVSPEAIAELAPKRSTLPALLSHGTSDPVLPYSVAEALRDHLQSAGWQLSWVPFSGGHGIPLDVVRAISALLPEWLC
jgi:phospholipase/carboxylesterase